MDLVLTVGEVVVDVHSPTGADLSAFVDATVTVALRSDYFVAEAVSVFDAEGPVHVMEPGTGDAFSVIPVAYGEELGQMIDDLDYERTFRALDVTTDDGVVSVKPGEVVTMHLDGLSYRFGAIAAYEVATIPGGEYSDCGGEAPMLSYEPVRIAEDATFPAVQRPAGVDMAFYSACG